MQPLRSYMVDRMLSRPGVTERDVHEYQRLLIEEDMIDPDFPRSPEETKRASSIQERLDHLSKLLLG